MRYLLAVLPWLAAAVTAQDLAFPNNSNRKERVPPSATAARCGSLIAWNKDLETTLAEANRTNKLVFWYVPTVAGSPMDRKPEVDRCMRGGPFADPEFAAFVNAHFVALDAVPKGKVQRELGLLREKFIEPGIVVLAADGKPKAMVDKLSTLSNPWLLAWLERQSGAKAPARKLEAPLASAWKHVRAWDLEAAEAALFDAELAKCKPAERAEALFLRGAVWMRSGRSDQARELWAKAGKELADEPWGWKCALEAEGHGPFSRGLEELRSLPAGALGERPDGSKAPLGLYDLATIRARCTAYLLEMQRENGGYDDSIYDFGGTDGLPNVWTATTAIVGLALLEAHPKGDDPRVESALARIVAYVSDDRFLAPNDADEQLWAHIYRGRMFARLIDLRPAQAEPAKRGLESAAKAILGMQLGSGAWYHEYPNPFVSASALLALKQAEAHGIQLDTKKVEKGVLALLSCRAEKTGAFS